MRKRKINLSRTPAKLKPRRLPMKLIIIIIIIFLAVSFTIRYLGKSLKNLDYFKIKEVMVSEGQAEEFQYLVGRNIFNIDLAKESRDISKFYPTYKKIKLIRVLPNRLFVDFVRRQALGVVQLYRYFYVDQDLVLFDTHDKTQELDLPLIVGLETKIFGPKIGEKYDITELDLALKIIKEFNQNRNLKDYKIKTIDVKKPDCASFFIPGDLEVKIGEDYIKERIDILSRLLVRLKNDRDKIKYIDLRFKEPVIKFK